MTSGATRPDAVDDDLDALADVVHRSLLARSLARPDPATASAEVRRLEPLLDRDAVEGVTRRVLARFDALGPLAGVIDDDVTEVLVDGPGPVRVERHGCLLPTGLTISAAELDVLIERLVGPAGRRVDQRSPIVDARLPDGSRLNVVVPPIAVDGPYVTIRRFPERWPALTDFGEGSVVELVARLVRDRMNVVVSGSTGAGKTSLMRALIDEAGDDERILTLEDAAEIDHPRVVRLEGRPPSVEGVGSVTLRDLVRTALRMRPDRIVVGEVRGGEAFDLVQALNTGHDGSLATVHANGPADALARLAVLCLTADVSLPSAVAEREVARAVDAVVHVVRGRSGRRRISAVLCHDQRDRSPRLLVADGAVIDGVGAAVAGGTGR